MITISMTQKQGLESMSAAAQIIDRIGSRPAQVANRLIGRFRNVDGFQLTSTSNRASFTASRQSVFIRSPEGLGVIEGALQCTALQAGRVESGKFRPLRPIPVSIAVGMPIAEHPPHRSRRACFTHRAPTLGI